MFQLCVTRYEVTMFRFVKCRKVALILIIYIKIISANHAIDLTKESYFKVFVPYELKVLR